MIFNKQISLSGLALSLFTFTNLLTVANLAFAQGPSNARTQLFILEKNRNPENIMVIYTQLDSECRVQKKRGGSDAIVFDFHWLMNRKDFKKVNPIIKQEIRKRLELLPSSDTHSFSVLMNDLKELDTDIKDFKLVVNAYKEKGKCVADSILKLGESDKNKKIKLESIYAESKGFLMPTVVAVTVKGTDVSTGEKVTRKYMGK